jgi:hypothetical protein
MKQKCSACEGRGVVPLGFYVGIHQTDFAPPPSYNEQCRTYNGQGVLSEPTVCELALSIGQCLECGRDLYATLGLCEVCELKEEVKQLKALIDEAKGCFESVIDYVQGHQGGDDIRINDMCEEWIDKVSLERIDR